MDPDKDPVEHGAASVETAAAPVEPEADSVKPGPPPVEPTTTSGTWSLVPCLASGLQKLQGPCLDPGALSGSNDPCLAPIVDSTMPHFIGPCSQPRIKMVEEKSSWSRTSEKVLTRMLFPCLLLGSLPCATLRTKSLAFFYLQVELSEVRCT